jgi:multiple antibiotic resistance protein
MHSAVNAFLLAFPALFSIVNPLSGALIFRARTEELTHEQRVRLARRIGAFSFLVMMVTLWAGSYVLAFFGITLAALRVAGGLMVALSAWSLLNAPERREARKQQQMDSAEAQPPDDVAFFPMTIPFTTGPGTIAVAIALGSAHPAVQDGLLEFFVGVSAAALAIAAAVWLSYSAADHVVRWLGPGGSKTVTRLGAFLLLCIGVQILITGVQDVLRPLLAARS